MIKASDMQAGDVIEFVSDRQTDKGPSSGACVLNDGSSVFLKHSDIECDQFLIRELEVNYVRNRPKYENAYWELA